MQHATVLSVAIQVPALCKGRRDFLKLKQQVMIISSRSQGPYKNFMLLFPCQALCRSNTC